MTDNERAKIAREKANAVGFDTYTYTRNFLILEDAWKKGKEPVVIRVDKRKGYNEEGVSLTLLHGEWPDLEALRETFFGGVPFCGGSTLRGAEHAHETGHVGITIWGCD